MQRAIEILILIHFIVIGLSHIIQHRAWAEFFIWLRAKGHAGVFANGFLSLWVGTLILALHPVWSGIPLLLTLFGVANVIKATTSFLIPSMGLRQMHRISLERSRIFIPAGALMLVFASVLSWELVRG